jgi:hypothetical protein
MLIGGQPFEPLSMTPRGVRVPARPGQPAMLLGGATGGGADAGQDTRMDYVVLDLGPEKVVARYVGSSERVAFNESVLRESLSSLQAQRFVPDDRMAIETLEWSTLNGRSMVPVPAGWSVEPGRPSPCSGLPQPASFTATFPAHDFTLVLRAAVWGGGEIVPDTAASACSSQRGPMEGASYASRGAWLGTPYVVEGVFVRAGSKQVVQFEVLATEKRAAFARALLGAWVKKTSEARENRD